MSTPIPSEFKDWYVGLSDSDRIVFLALVSGELTIHGRAFVLDLSGEAQIIALKGLNEIQHKISFHIAAIGAKHKRYSEDVFLEILFSEAGPFGLSAHLAQSLTYARTHHDWRK